MDEGHAVTRDDAMAARFEVPQLSTVHPVAGPTDTALLIEEHRTGALARIWHAGRAPSDLLAFEVGRGALLTPDSRWVIDIADDGGSEVGTLIATSTDGSEVVDLTPDREPFVLRGLEISADGSVIVATVVDEAGFHVLVIPADPWGPARMIYSDTAEAWYAHASPDAALVSVDTTEHSPGVRRPALTIVDVATGARVAVLDDLPAGPVRGVRFSSVVGDDRMLLNTERSGFARPAIWNVRTGFRTDFDLPDLRGDVVAVDWHARSGRVLAVHFDTGGQRLLEIDEADGSVREVLRGGSFANPDVADLHPFQWTSYFAPDGTIRAVRSSWETPLHIQEVSSTGSEARTLIEPAPVPAGTALSAESLVSADGTALQLWWGRPDGDPVGTVLAVHGGPNLVTIDEYDPSAQSWIEHGFAYASLNYRGSVTFGRAFREGFWGAGGDREIEDVEAAISWLRAQGLANPASTFITGASFGGHLTLLSMGRLPDAFAGGLAHVAVADWASTISEMNPAVRAVWSSWVPPELVEKFSALTYVNDITGSVWINQGAVDTRTPVVGVQRFVDELAERGGDIVLEIFDGGHEPTGLEILERDQRRMLDLVRRTSRGERWSEPPPSAAAD